MIFSMKSTKKISNDYIKFMAGSMGSRCEKIILDVINKNRIKKHERQLTTEESK